MTVLEPWRYWDELRNRWINLKQEDVHRIKNELKTLPYAPASFFEINSEVTYVMVASLMPTRARVEGIINANNRMISALAGRCPPRQPISIVHSHIPDKFLIRDGNSTYFNCSHSEWLDMPCMVIGSD